MAEAKWYVVHTYSGYENKVKANIEKTIENNKELAEQILEVRVPLEDVVEMKNGTKKTVQRKMFPGYVLLNMEMNDDTCSEYPWGYRLRWSGKQARSSDRSGNEASGNQS